MLNRDTLLTSASGSDDWQAVCAGAITDPAELCRLLRLAPQLASAAKQAAAEFPMLVPRPYVERIRPADPDDPLLRQVLPRMEELAPAPGFSADPLGESAAGAAQGLLRKYYGRALILATGGCPVHCRFCFRRHVLRAANCAPAQCPSLVSLPSATFSRAAGGFTEQDSVGGALGGKIYRVSGETLSAPRLAGELGVCAQTEDADVVALPSNLAAAVDLLAADRSVSEVILSGGDPLCLADVQLAALLGRLRSIGHVRRLRIHTRMPIVVPQRVTDDLVGLLRGTRPPTLVVVHVNHPAEIDQHVEGALARLIDAGIPVLSQTVLLRGVNDSVESLGGLYQRLADLRVVAYYLHQLDRVAGAAHFEVPVEAGIKLMTELRRRLPGYAVPRYVRELPGASCKQLLA